MPEKEKMDVDSLKSVSLDSNNFEFKEDKIMTCYEGYWIQKANIREVVAIHYRFTSKVAANKKIATDDQKNTEVARLMKKVLRKEHRMLKMALGKKTEGKDALLKKSTPTHQVPEERLHKVKVPEEHLNKVKVPEEHLHMVKVPEERLQKVKGPKKPAKYLGINYGGDPDIVKYDGFYIHKKSKDRLDKLKEKLTQKGVSAADLRKAIKKECRKEERLIKRAKKPKAVLPSTPVQREMYMQPNTPVQPEVNMQPITPVQPELNMQPTTPMQPKTTWQQNTYQQREIFLQPKPYTPPTNNKKPFIDPFIKPKSHMVFDD